MNELSSLQLRVAELEQRSARLAEKEAQHRAFIETSQDWIWEIDIQGLIVYSNPAVEKILGYQPHELMGRLCYDLMRKAERKRVQEILAQHISQRTGWRNLLLCWHKKGGGRRCLESNSVPVIDDQGALSGFRGVDRDITERIRVEQKLSASERFNRSIIESSNDCIKILDLEGQLLYLNEAGQRQMHIKDLDAFLNIPYTQFWNGSDQDESLRAISAARAGGKGRFTGYAATVDGEPRWWDVVISPVLGADGKVKRLLAVSRDITEPRQAEDALRTLVETMVGITGQAYFDKVTTELCRWFGADGATIGVLDQGERIRAISMELDGQKVPEYAYPLKGTPCRQVVTEGPCVFPQDIKHLFPKDKDLVELSIQGYAGAPIRDQAGRVIGIVWVMSRKPLKPPAQWKAVLNIVAAKTSAEIERKRAEAALSRRLETEKLVTSVSARFINVRPDKLDEEISICLRRIGEFSGADRCYLFQFSADGTTMDNTHEWCATGIEPHIDRLQRLSVEHFGYSMTKMRAGEVLHVPLVADLPPEAQAEVQEFESEGILSLINVPVQIGGITAGFLGFDMVRKAKAWPEQDRRMIRLVGETFAMALKRKRFEEDTQRSLREKEVLLREIHHRVKNNMQIVSSLLVLQSSRTRNREAIGILEDGRQRVQAMALAHEKIYSTADLAHIDLREYLTSLLSSIRSTYLEATPGVSVQAHIEKVTSNMDQAIPIGLLVNELVSNALKHAFPEGGSGAISVDLALEAGEMMIELTVTDDGVGLPRGLEWRNVSTLGLTLVRELSSQLGGRIELLEQSHGTAFRIRFKQATV